MIKAKNNIKKRKTKHIITFAHFIIRLRPAIFIFTIAMSLFVTCDIFKYNMLKPFLKSNQINITEYKLPQNTIKIKPSNVTEIIVEKSKKTKNYNDEDTFRFQKTNMYTKSKVNLREEPSTESNIVDTINFATKVLVINQIDNWYEVCYNDVIAFIRNDLLTTKFPAIKVSSTAYYDQYNRASASGRPLIMNHSIAGKIEWLGKRVNIYSCNSDDSIGSFIGTFQFDDTGYGQSTGIGSSQILNGKTIGTIENGTCIDIYMDTIEQCYAYGRKNVYIQFVN